MAEVGSLARVAMDDMALIPTMPLIARLVWLMSWPAKSSTRGLSLVKESKENEYFFSLPVLS